MAPATIQANVKGPHNLDVRWVPSRVQTYVAKYMHVPFLRRYNLAILFRPSLVLLKAPDELPQAVAMLGKLSMNSSHSRLRIEVWIGEEHRLAPVALWGPRAQLTPTPAGGDTCESGERDVAQRGLSSIKAKSSELADTEGESGE